MERFPFFLQKYLFQTLPIDMHLSKLNMIKTKLQLITSLMKVVQLHIPSLKYIHERVRFNAKVPQFPRYSRDIPPYSSNTPRRRFGLLFGYILLLFPALS